MKFWEKCNGIIISSAKSVLVILREKKMKLGLLCVSSPENSVESCEVKGYESQMLVFASISWLIKYIHSSSFSKYIDTESSIDVLSNTVNFSDAHQMRFLRHLQKFMSKLQEDAYIAKSQALIEQGPYYICTVCHRLLYRNSVVTLCSLMAYELRHIITDKLSFDNEKYICKTCHNKLKKNKIPCQAVFNKLQVFDDSEELKALNKLETILIAQRLCFQKILIMSKGQQRKIRGAVCNVPVNFDAVCHVHHLHVAS